MSKTLNVKYITYWNSCSNIETNAVVNILTGEVSEIETVDVDNSYNICKGEFIRYEDGSMEQVVSDHDDGYVVVSESEEPHVVIEIDETKYTVLSELDADDIRRICNLG